MGNQCTQCRGARKGLQLLHSARQGRKRIFSKGKKFAPFGACNYIDEPMNYSSFEASDMSVPEKVDLRGYMTAVEDQCQSNTCVANAVAGAYEYISKREEVTGNKDTTGDISRLFIYYVGRKRDQESMGEDTSIAPKDEGMSLGGGITALQSQGACLEQNWPFDLQKLNERPGDDCFTEATKYKIADSQKIDLNLTVMKQCLAKGNPIIFGLKLTAKFFDPHPCGFIQTPDPSNPKSAEHGLHAMLLVGYNDRQQVFIVRNSWGTGFGDNGYAYIPYDYVGNSSFNFLGMYAITALTSIDFTPDADDGKDFAIDTTIKDEEVPELEHQEEAEEDHQAEK